MKNEIGNLLVGFYSHAKPRHGVPDHHTAQPGPLHSQVFAQQSYYHQLVTINNWQVTFFRSYPFPWELWIEAGLQILERAGCSQIVGKVCRQDLNYNLVKLGESEHKPSYDQIVAWTEAYEEPWGCVSATQHACIPGQRQLSQLPLLGNYMGERFHS